MLVIFDWFVVGVIEGGGVVRKCTMVAALPETGRPSVRYPKGLPDSGNGRSDIVRKPIIGLPEEGISLGMLGLSLGEEFALRFRLGQR
jgi:hypothetical protein